MDFRTEINPSKFPFQINHKSKLLSIGSCFADMIGQRLHRYKFDVSANPFGNIYNPVSVHNVLKPDFDFSKHYIENQDIWFNYDLHSEISALSEQALLSLIQQKKEALNTILKEADTIVITYGTAWVYELISDLHIVANCHKQPNSLFNKRLLTIEEIENSFEELLKTSPQIKNIVLTVSPVRHIKDTLELNTVSKSILRVAVHNLTQKHANVHYFPSYELVLDDLRDYRFYKKDLIHPNEMAEDYVWDKFSKASMNEETLKWLKIIDEINQAVNHKPFHPNSEQHQQFLKAQIKKIENLDGQLNFEKELGVLKAQLVQ